MDRRPALHRAVYIILAFVGLVVLAQVVLGLSPCRSVFPMFDMIDNLADVKNQDGIIATIRRTRAALLSVDTPIPYYVFVHQQGIQDRSCNLVFKYETTDNGWRDAPRVSWRHRSSLRIAVANERDIARIIRQSRRLKGIQITYVIGHHQPR